jgi:DNA polymerase III delta' subunit
MARRSAAAAAEEELPPIYRGPVPTFATLVGHGATARLLQRLTDSGHLPHALLLDGPPGCGRRTVALVLAKALLCRMPVAGDACGTCPSCLLVDAGNHPDLVVLRDDRQQERLSVDEIRELVARAANTPLAGERQVFVLPAIERLHPSAANALLKVLEEPPPATRLVLTCGDAERLLPTIRSRTQRFHLQTLSVDEATQVLELAGFGPRARRLAAAGGGDLRKAHEEADGSEAPVTELSQLLLGGYHPQRIAKLHADLEARSPQHGQGTPAARNRALLRHWLNALLDHERAGLRGQQPERSLERIGRVLQCRRDLNLNLQPRLVLDSLAQAS